jgi:hypothetical protein
MARANAFVSRYVSVEQRAGVTAEGMIAAAAGISFRLDDGRQVQLDPADRRSPGFAQVLMQLARLRRPVYLELDPETEAVSRIEVPEVGRIRSVREIDGGLEIELDSSHARLSLSRDSEDAEQLEARLRDAVSRKALTIVTADAAQNVLDISFFSPGPDDGPLPDFLGGLERRPPLFRDFVARFLLWRFWPWRWWSYRCLSVAYAQQVFDAMSATTCNPVAINPPCIPFLYPRDGCWGRAHEMRRLMVNLGLAPGKIWIQGSLHTPTRNVNTCFVNWGWHVAPTLCVRRRVGGFWPWLWWSGETMVFDPSLFTTPVTPAQWKQVQGDPNASLTYTAGEIFWLWQWGPYTQTDPAYTQTAQVLATYRAALQNQVNQDGPPPYANCP